MQNSGAVTLGLKITYRDGFLLAERVFVTEPDLHGAIRPGGAQTVAGQDAVWAHSVPPGALALAGHPPPPTWCVEQSRPRSFEG